MKFSGIGGQAVLEGVMMKNGAKYAVAVRKPDKDVAVETGEFHSAAEKYKFLGAPFIRGVVNFIESLKLGMETLTLSSNYYEEGDSTEPSAFEKALKKTFGEKAENIMMGLTVCLSVVLAVAIFMILPFFISSLLEKVITSEVALAAIEGLIRIAIFIGYVLAISLMKDIRRVFMYHGAEHKSINCIENGLPLTVENVRKMSRRHKRCGTSFMLFVIVLSAVFFMFIRVDNMLLRVVLRVLLVPIIAGLSYEILRLAGRSESKAIDIISKPGLWLQGLTTREPDDTMIEVAIASVEAVFDWKAFIGVSDAEEAKGKSGSGKSKADRKAEQRKAEEARKAEKARKAEEAKQAEEASKAEEAKQAEEARKAEEARQAEEARKAEEARQAEEAKEAALKIAAEAEQKREVRPAIKAKKKVSHAPVPDRGARQSIEQVGTAMLEENEDDDILNALDRFFTSHNEK